MQAYILWQAFQTAQPVDSPGSGLLAYSIVAGRQSSSWTLPRGGSGELARALVDCLQAHGGELRCGTRVAELVRRERPLHGRRHRRRRADRRARAVVSTIHVKKLVEMAPRRCMGRRLPRRRRDVRRRHLDVRAVLRDDRGAASSSAARRRYRPASSAGRTRCCRPVATCAPAASCADAGCSSRRRRSSTRRARPRGSTRVKLLGMAPWHGGELARTT